MATPTSAAAFSATTNRLTAATYDNAGNLTAHPYVAPSGSISYDANNLATQFTASGITGTYAYDAQGRRVRQTHNGKTTIYVYDAMGRLAVEYANQAPAQTGGVYYRTTDHLGSTRIVTDSAGAVKLRSDFFPFGEEIPADASHGNRHQVLDGGVATYNAWTGIAQQFTGQQRDDTGLDYFWARNYFGPSGRFLSVDPGNAGASLGFPQAWNGYGYVNNNPLEYVDPTGKFITNSNCIESGGQVVNGLCIQGGSDPWAELPGLDPRIINNPLVRWFLEFRRPRQLPTTDDDLFVGLNDDDTAVLQSGLGGLLRVAGRVGFGLGRLGVFGLLAKSPQRLNTVWGQKLLQLLKPKQLNQLIGDQQRVLVKQLFGQGEAGAYFRLNNLVQPEGLTRETLIVYREIARRVVARGPNNPGYKIQKVRLDILETLLARPAR